MHLNADDRRLGIRVLVAAGVTVVVGVAVWLVVQLRPIERFDSRLSRHLHDWAVDHGAVERTMRFVTQMGSPLTLAGLVLAVGAGLVAAKRPDLATWLVVVAAAGGLTEVALKLVIGRTRPDLDTAFVLARGNSFPSGHAMNSAIVFGAVVLALTSLAPASTRLAVLLGGLGVVIVAAVGLSRPILGVHFTSDVVAGWTLAAVWLATVEGARRVQSTGSTRSANPAR